MDVHCPRLVRILDLETFEDDLLPLPTDHDPHAGDGERAPRFREPWLERQGQGVPFLRHTIAPHAAEPRGEPRIRRRDRLGSPFPQGPSLHAHRPSKSDVHRCGIWCLWTTFCQPALVAQPDQTLLVGAVRIAI